MIKMTMENKVINNRMKTMIKKNKNLKNKNLKEKILKQQLIQINHKKNHNVKINDLVYLHHIIKYLLLF